MMLRQASSRKIEAAAPHTANGDYNPLDGAPFARRASEGGPSGGRYGRTREKGQYDPLRWARGLLVLIQFLDGDLL